MHIKDTHTHTHTHTHTTLLQERVAGADVPMPYAKNLETAALPQVMPLAASKTA
jgi:hypothetical protein